MTAALKAGVERVVYTSVVAALKPGKRRSGGRNLAPYAGKRHRRLQAQQAGGRTRSRTHDRQEKLPAVIVAPSTPIGPRDIKPTPTGRIIVEAATGKMPAFVDTGLNLVHVDDVAEGHFLALEKGRIGENYILGGEDVSLQTMLADIAAWSAAGRRKSNCHAAPLFPLAWGAEASPASPARNLSHRRCLAHVALSDVLFLRQGENGTGI